MGLSNIIAIIGIAVLVMQSTNCSYIPASADPCTCTREYVPICGSDDITYANHCLFNCEKVQNTKLQIKFYGECEEETEFNEVEECNCPNRYVPVCGTDHITYDNECSLNCEKRNGKIVSIQYIGECRYNILNPPNY